MPGNEQSLRGLRGFRVFRWRERLPITARDVAGRLGVSAGLLYLALGPIGGLAQQDTQQQQPSETVSTTELPEDVPSLEQRGDLYMVRKFYAEAVRVYRKLTELQPRNALFRNKLGIAYHQMQDLNSARREYRRAVQLNPQYAQAINNLASVEYARKRYRSAINTYLRALKLTPGDAVIYSNLGTAYFAQEEFEYATQSFRYALMLDPEIFRRTGRVGTIVQQRSDQNPAVFNFYMAKTYASSGNVEETLQYLIKAWEEGYPELRKTVVEDNVFRFLDEEPRFVQLLALMESGASSPATRPIQQ
jgi:tetratricopeptide (TPR) repeat protein